MKFDIDPEGFVREGGDCVCGPMYSYAGTIEPGQFSSECPVHWMPPPDQAEGEDYLDYLTRVADFYRDYPPPAGPHLSLIDCDAEPRHWPTYEVKTHDFYPAVCLQCVMASMQEMNDALHRKFHWIEHPVRGRWASKIIGCLRTLGVIASYGLSYGGPTDCSRCVIAVGFRGHRGYILGWPDWKWACLFRRGHWPGEYVGFGLCGKCAPWPCCGATTREHAAGCDDD